MCFFFHRLEQHSFFLGVSNVSTVICYFHSFDLLFFIFQLKIDFKDRETCEGLFKEYWGIVKEIESLISYDINAANKRLEKIENQQQGRVSKKNYWGEEDDDFIVVESNKNVVKEQPLCKSKISEKQKFIGWGSKPLIEFLKSIGCNR